MSRAVIINTAEASKLIGLGQERIRQLCRCGELPALKIHGWQIKLKDVERFLRKRKTGN